MDWRLFGSTFVLIFLAELGDKTQLAAFASAAGSKSTWSVFLGASLALVLSTLIAVLIGSGVQKVAPAHVIRGVAGGLFLLFGLLLVWSAFHPEEKEKEPEAEKTAPETPGLAVRAALEAAELFETAAAERYEAMARQAGDEESRHLLAWLAKEETKHAHSLGELGAAHRGAELSEEAPPSPFLHEAAESETKLARSVLLDAVRHEEEAAAFYHALAARSHLPGLAEAFETLAGEESEHARHLRELAG
jgi:Ca2+/H+ antiporter, TMEM165/GDT1 family